MGGHRRRPPPPDNHRARLNDWTNVRRRSVSRRPRPGPSGPRHH
jgi:hypothetical protein